MKNQPRDYSRSFCSPTCENISKKKKKRSSIPFEIAINANERKIFTNFFFTNFITDFHWKRYTS